MITNPDLPISVQLPGVYVYLSLIGAAPVQAPLRVLFLSHKTSAGTAQAGTLFRAQAEDEVVTKCGTGSGLHRYFRAFAAQGGATVGAETWFMPVSAPSGTAQTKFIMVLEAPTGAVLGSTGTGAAAAGYWTLWIAGKQYDSTIANGSTYATIMQDMVSVIQADQDFLPCTAAYSGGQIVLTSRVAALAGQDFSVMVRFSSAAMLLSASCGTLTVSGASSGAGSLTIRNYQDWSASVTIANLDTAVTTSAALTAAINASNATVMKAAEPSPKTGEITLFYVDERPLNFIGAEITSTITQTIAGAFGTAASGLPSSSSPSLSTVLTNLAASQLFKLWVTDFTGQAANITTAGMTQLGTITDYSVMGSLASHLIQQNGGGMGQNKGQVLMWAHTAGLAYFGAVHTSTSPNLTTTPLTFPQWSRSNPMPVGDIAARAAAIVARNIDYPPFNYAGQVFVTDQRTPWMLPHPAVRPTDPDTNACMVSYFGAPLRTNDSGQLAIVSGRTSAKPSATIDKGYAFWGFMLTDLEVRERLLVQMAKVIQGKNLKAYGESHTEFCTTTDALKTAVGADMFAMDALDWFDGASDIIPALQVERNPQQPARVDVKLPKRFPYPLEQLSVVAQLAS